MKKNLLDKTVKQFRSKIWFYIIALFIISRFLYVLIGMPSINVLSHSHPDNVVSTAFPNKISDHTAIQIWYSWDAGHYGNLAKNYNYFSFSKLSPTVVAHGATGYYQLSWFPLYPVTIKLVHVVTRLNIAYSQLLISNVAFLLALFVLYKLVRIDEDDAFAKKVLVFMLVLPVSFIFSSGLSESLFLFLALASFYAARTERWLWAGVFGLLVALTRSTGFIMAAPLAIEAIQRYGWPSVYSWQKWLKPVAGCAGPLLGLGLFMFYCWIRTGDLFAYNHSQLAGWDISLHSPFTYMLRHWHRASVIIIVGMLASVGVAWRNLRPSYITYASIYILMTCSLGELSNSSSLRYAGIAFPVAMACAYLARRKYIGDFLLLSLAILNGALFIMWANWWTQYII